MKTILCACAVALAMAGLLSNAPTATASELNYASEQSQMATTIDVARIHGVLRLTAQQEPLWAPVESALRDIVRQQQVHSGEAGFLKRVSHRVVSIVMTSAAVERLARAARPLIRALDDQQKQAASDLAHEMGLGPVVMAALK